PREALPRALRLARAARPRALRRRDSEPRLRRSGAAAPRRLGSLAGRRPRGQLRGAAADPHRPRKARPPLVPGQPAAYRRAGLARVQAAQPAAPWHGRDVVPLLAAVAAAAGVLGPRSTTPGADRA